MRIGTLLKITFILIGDVLVTKAGIAAKKSFDELSAIRQAGLLAEVGTLATDATVAMSLERSVVQVALAYGRHWPAWRKAT